MRVRRGTSRAHVAGRQMRGARRVAASGCAGLSRRAMPLKTPLTTLALLTLACTPGPGTTDSATTHGGSTEGTGGSTAATASATESTGAASTGPTASTGATTAVETSSTGTGTTSTSTSTTDGPPPAAACGMEGGICIAAGSCAPAGGTVAPSSPGGCFFDDGPAECCVPPGPVPDAMTCAEAGGLCAPIGGCLDAGGYLTSIDGGCEFQGVFACCVPHDRCGDQTIECCDGPTVFNPTCDAGVFVCPAGVPMPIGTCL